MILDSILASIRRNGGNTRRYSYDDTVEEAGGGTWCVPALSDETEIVSPRNLGKSLRCFIEKHRRMLIKEGIYLGGWLKPKNRQYYRDSITARDELDEALMDSSSNQHLIEAANSRAL
jgi:hypothetical protein